MIRSRFGPEVFLVIDGNVEAAQIDVVFKLENGSIEEKVSKTFINELRATDGFNEIVNAVESAHKRIEMCNELMLHYIQTIFDKTEEQAATMLSRYVVKRGVISLLDLSAHIIWYNENKVDKGIISKSIERDLSNWNNEKIISNSGGYHRKIKWERYLFPVEKEGKFTFIAIEQRDKQFLNYYNCPCGYSWVDVWSVGCNDRCKKCKKEIEPYKTKYLGK